MSQEQSDLSTHVSLCQLRYQQLEQRLNGVESRLSKIEADMSALKISNAEGFSQIKLLLEQRNTSKQTQVLASAATIIVALITVLGYILVQG